ncbi:flagellar hook-basal body complex protein FliE [Pseudoalteromonas marina]|uniref:Flagellar hook-basal body complex protein FliE n=1 Tax=Pseudoalteromonas marina TaxID=267375 RepID=A0ABT9FC33_9GAMM|nr:flagellar hook-basal body complex protein FliE [Pseudoalteromonas marina]MDP2564339.1 flagellar hook-basal body complex protein FliE [Pseudoalteromonas marina]
MISTVTPLAFQPLAQSIVPEKAATGGSVFSQVLKNLDGKVNASAEMKKKYLQGDSDVSLTEVMVTSQAAKLDMAYALEVRNSLTETYRDVMNMPV